MSVAPLLTGRQRFLNAVVVSAFDNLRLRVDMWRLGIRHDMRADRGLRQRSSSVLMDIGRHGA